MRKPFTCPLCNRVTDRKSKTDHRKYCSAACATAGHKRSMAQRPHRTVTIIENGYHRTYWPIKCLHCGNDAMGSRPGAKYCSVSCQLNYEYAKGLRDPVATSDAAHAVVRANGLPSRRGMPIPQFKDPAVWAKVSATKLKQHAEFRRANGLREPTESVRLHRGREARAWRAAVFERDAYTCVACGDSRGGNLEADHIRPVLFFPELVLDVSNGRTLCHPCHVMTPTYGSKIYKLTRADFDVAA